MTVDEKTSKLIADLEYEIGSECYNPNSYDGWNEIEGCEFRYPIWFPDKEGDYVKVRSNLNTSYLLAKGAVSPETVPYMKYKFGSNELMIGQGLINVLTYLEKRYGISFNQLEDSVSNPDNES